MLKSVARKDEEQWIVSLTDGLTHTLTENIMFFYKHSVFQSEARICLSFSQIEPQNMLKICLT